ncbi:MAG: ATP-binding protein [Paludibacteraceae bacterium]|nr:ATP-binding protein [Paludibacteraceae bacterium]
MGYELKRKIDLFLYSWKKNPQRNPLIVKGARQIGKTSSIRNFAQNYSVFVEINFVTNPQFKRIFDKSLSVDSIISEISFIDPKIKFIEGDTLILFDELQACPNCATSLKFFKEDGRFDVVCSGSLMGLNYQEIDSNSVGFKDEYEMRSLDFEEFLWAKGYSEAQIDHIYNKMKSLEPYTSTEMDVMLSAFADYMVVGGMPAVVNSYLKNHFSGVLDMQKSLIRDYEEDITKYAVGLDKGKIKNIYNHIPVFLGKENKKFQISKVAKGARSREYVGTVDWLNDAGIVNICYNLEVLELPLKGNYKPNEFKLYFHDPGLIIATLDDEAQIDLRENRNFNTYKGAIYENVVADCLVMSGYQLFYYKNEKATIEMDFFIRDSDSLVPVEVKANDNATASLTKLIESEKYPEIKYGIKLCRKNIGYNGKFYTFPYFCAFLLKRYMQDKIRGI